MKQGRFAKFAEVCTHVCLVLAVALVLSACGEDRTGTIPNAADPFAGNGGQIPGNGRLDGSIASLMTGGVAMNLYDPSTGADNIAGLEDILKPTHYLYLPLVGNPLFKMDIKSGSGSTISERVYMSVESKTQAWAAAIAVVEGATLRTSTSLDMTFSDLYLTVRVIAAITTAGKLNGSIYYRNRSLTWNGSTWAANEQQCFASSSVPSSATGPACRDAYMSTSSTSVKKLGSFSANYTDWVK